jgi:hypothetical protein
MKTQLRIHFPRGSVQSSQKLLMVRLRLDLRSNMGFSKEDIVGEFKREQFW